MPIDPTVEAAPLVASPQEISPVEQQNRYGAQHQTITDLEAGKFVTVLAIQTQAAFTPEQFFEILTYLRENYGVDAMQTAFACTVPDFEGYRNNLYLSAHLRADQKNTPYG